VNPAVREATKAAEGEDPIYGKVYLPRKFKIGVAIQPLNDADIYSQDVGLVPHVVNGEVEGYTITVGGGFGMSHGQLSTRPFLGQPLLYAKRANVVDAIEAVVTTQRDHGNRTERKNARLKYTVQTMGLDGFRAESSVACPASRPSRQRNSASTPSRTTSAGMSRATASSTAPSLSAWAASWTAKTARSTAALLP
jgi:sulfite reductase beta subunit-like hemoprotein